MKFVAPEMATGESQPFSSTIVPPGGMFPQERLRGMPDELIYAMAAALNDAAAEMEVNRTRIKLVAFFFRLLLSWGLSVTQPSPCARKVSVFSIRIGRSPSVICVPIPWRWDIGLRPNDSTTRRDVCGSLQGLVLYFSTVLNQPQPSSRILTAFF